jgi:hypothetical protein
MLLTRHGTAGSFLRAAGDSLERDEAANSLILGLARLLVERPERFEGEPFLATVERDGEAVAAALAAPPSRVVLWAAETTRPLAALADALLVEGVETPGAVGPAAVAGAFAAAWAARTGGAACRGRRLRAFQLRAAEAATAPAPPETGRLRPAGEAEVDLVARWLDAFRDETGVAMASPRAVAEQQVAAGDLHLWHDREPVAMAAVLRRTRHGAGIGHVYTPPERRRRGHARAGVGALSRLLLERGASFCALFADLDEPGSNRLCLDLGFRPVADLDEYDFA